MGDITILHFVKSGMLTTIQDLGREGYRHMGVPPGGMLDRKAGAMANRLVGNKDNSPVLEITMSGPVVDFLVADCTIALTGADISPHLDGKPLSMNTAHAITRGQRLTFGKLRSGCRAYLAVGGDWQTDLWLGSASAFLQDPQDILPASVIGKGHELSVDVRHSVPQNFEFEAPSPHSVICDIQVLPGPEYNLFDREAIEFFLKGLHTASNDSSRMGIRLSGKINSQRLPSGLISSGVVPPRVSSISFRP